MKDALSADGQKNDENGTKGLLKKLEEHSTSDLEILKHARFRMGVMVTLMIVMTVLGLQIHATATATSEFVPLIYTSEHATATATSELAPLSATSKHATATATSELAPLSNTSELAPLSNTSEQATTASIDSSFALPLTTKQELVKETGPSGKLFYNASIVPRADYDGTTCSRPKLHVCGSYVGTVVSGLGLLPISKEPTDAVLIVDGMCKNRAAWQSFKGPVLYIDGEHGAAAWYKTAFPLARKLYIGPTQQRYPQVHDYLHASLESLRVNVSKILQMQHRQQSVAATAKPHFLAYANRNCVKFRETAFNRLVAMAKNEGFPAPVAFGRCNGGHRELSNPSLPRTNRLSNGESFKKFRFILCMENANIPNYVTEKILFAFLANAVPIYYGTKSIFNIFNRRAFVFYDVANPEEALKRVRYLESNRTAYAEVLREPVFVNNSLQRYFSLAPDRFGGGLRQKILGLLKFQTCPTMNT